MIRDTHDKAATSLDSTTPRSLPLEQLAGLKLVGAHLVDAAIRVAAVVGRRRRPEGELGHDLVLASLNARKERLLVLPESLCGGQFRWPLS